MKLSTRSIYGMHAMLTLAMEEGHGPIMAKDIARRQRLPVNYLEQLLLLLRKANLVSATRGVRGGYVLARSPSEISVADVVETLEGAIELVGSSPRSGCCSRPETCALPDVWAEAKLALKNALQAVTLDVLAERQRQKETSLAPTYSI